MPDPDTDHERGVYRGPDRRRFAEHDRGDMSVIQAFRLIGVDINDQESVAKFNETQGYAAEQRKLAGERRALWQRGVISALLVIAGGVVTWVLAHFSSGGGHQ
jgi:hypothetical protein